MRKLVTRHVLPIITSRLQDNSAVVVTGARQTGKTTLCDSILPRALKKEHTYITFDDPDERLRFQTDPISILESFDNPLIVLDEIQKIPSLFDPLKYVIDKGSRNKQKSEKKFVLTGSSRILLMEKVKETLAGRVALINLHTFSCSEILEHSSEIFLKKVWDSGAITSEDLQNFSVCSIPDVRKVKARVIEHKRLGGYPKVWEISRESNRIAWLKDYRQTFLERDLFDSGQVHSIDTFALTQKMLCALTGQILNYTNLGQRVGLSANTVKRYIRLLHMSFQCYLLQPFFRNISKRLVKSAKIYIPDTGLIKTIIGESSLYSGALYESWVFYELFKWKQLQIQEPELFYYRTGTGFEIDFILHRGDLTVPIEVKAANKLTRTDARRIETFLAEIGKKARFGLIVYPGDTLYEIRKHVWAVPDWYLFSSLYRNDPVRSI